MAGVRAATEEFLRDTRESFRKLSWYEWIMIAVMVAIAAQAVYAAFANPLGSKNPAWLTVINFVSAVCGIVCVFFCAHASIPNFLFGLVNTTVYAIYLWYWKIYATFALEVLFYFPMGILAWRAWANNRDALEREQCLTRRLSLLQGAALGAAVIASGIVYHSVLVRFGGTVPWLDAYTFAIGIIAIFLQFLRFREQYVLWLLVDFVSVAMYIVHFDPVYLTKRSIYTVVALIGLYNWQRLNRSRNPTNR